MKNLAASLMFLVLLFSQTSRSQEASALQQRQIPLEHLLNEDGSLRRDPQIFGSVDPKGFNMKLDPNGAPIFERGTPADFSSSPLESALRLDYGQPLAADPDDIYWDGGFSLPGASGRINGMAYDGSGRLYVGGDFTTIGDKILNRVAVWDGFTWSALGSGMNSAVQTLEIADDGTLYAGGYFTYAGGIAARYIAKWDGSNWSGLGSGMNHIVWDLVIAGDGTLYAGGYFTYSGGIAANHIAKWDGSSWSALGSGLNKEVYILAVANNGTLFAGGEFSTAGDISANYIAQWNGSSWSALGSGMDWSVTALAVAQDGTLYAGGGFDTAGGITVNCIAKWDGSSWSAMGSGIPPTCGSLVNGLVMAEDGILYAGGYFTSISGVSANHIAKWDGSSWSALGSGMGGVEWPGIGALIITEEGRLYAGGLFGTAGGIGAANVASWNGSDWSALGTAGNGLSREVRDLTIAGDGTLYASGYFTSAGGIVANRVARWNGSSWSVLGSGINGVVCALALAGDGTLYASGAFTAADGFSANRIAKWKGSSWSAMGSGINAEAYALTVANDGTLYAGGWFTVAGGGSARYVAKWDASSWSSLGSGVDSCVRALAIGSDATLYACGDFTLAGESTANYIAKWNGSSWSALGLGMNNSVHAIAVAIDGTVYAGGEFTNAGGIAANHIAKWDGSSWSAVGSGIDNTVTALAVADDGTLYAGGEFTNSGGTSAIRIAKWDGSSWSALGSGMNGAVKALAISENGTVYAGGLFTAAGEKVSCYMAIWHKDEHAIPPSWTVVSTSKNSSIEVPAVINPTLDGVALKSGDAIGTFYLRDGAPVCGGYCIWQTGESGAVTVFGDDELTTLKDGFAEGELINYRIWDSASGTEWSANATYQMGGPNYSTNGIMVLASLAGYKHVTQNIALPSGWSMISSYVSPQAPLLTTMMADIVSQMTLMKNGAGQVFWPAFGINNIGSWNYRHGYQIHMKSPMTLAVTGSPLQPESSPLPLAQGWNIAAYLRASAMPIQTALSGIVGSMVLAKNGAGQVYWPAFGINTIGSMQPGQGYQMYLTQATTLTYPANALSKETPAAGNSRTDCVHFTGGHRLTGANAVMIWRGLPFADGDEIAVLDGTSRMVGAGVVHSGQALLVVWGDNAETGMKDGAGVDEVLVLRHWSRNENVETMLLPAKIMDALTGQPLSGGIHYAQDCAWVLEGIQSENNSAALEYQLAQNYPNPFNPSTEVNFTLPRTKRVKLNIYNTKGECVRLLFDGKAARGVHSMTWNGADDLGRQVPGGIYFLKMRCDAFEQVVKMALIK